MNGVTGRMGLNQHLRRSIHAIMEQGGVRLADDEASFPTPSRGAQTDQAGAFRVSGRHAVYH